MPSHALKVEVPADGSVPPPSMPRVPRRVLHFSDGTLEEYSTDEEDGVEPKVVQQSVTQLSSIDPKTLAWLPWFWYQTATAGSKTLEVCDYLGESLASFFGITTPKYQFEIDHYQQMLAEEEELKKQQDLEMGGWVAKSSENGGGEKNSDSITKAPSLQRFVIYKLPRLKHHANHLVRQGKAYAFITSESNNGWTPSDMGITDENSIPGLTLAPIYEDGAQENLLYILYNDQIPQHSKSRLSGGHSKGAVVGDHSGGFWLVHSVPHYPNDPRTSEDHSYPHTGLRNGQSFLCITMKPRQLKKTGQALWYNEVHAFATNIPVDLHGMYSKLAAVAYGESVDSPPWNSSYPIISAGGTTFRVFAKSQHYHKELYSYWVAPALRVSISVQTWPNGQSHQQSSCNGRYNGVSCNPATRRSRIVDSYIQWLVDAIISVENIEETKVAGVRFSTKNDHSKWVVSESKRHPWVCVGDINKDDSQEKRGGGTVCVKDKFLWKAYHRSVVDVERCH